MAEQIDNNEISKPEHNVLGKRVFFRFIKWMSLFGRADDEKSDLVWRYSSQKILDQKAKYEAPQPKRVRKKPSGI